jgi:hypothetical protein
MMTDSAKPEAATLMLRTQSKHDTDGATHAIRSNSGEMLVVWPESGVARYKNGNIQPCPISARQFDDLLRELDPPSAPLKWRKVDDHQEATTTMPAGKIPAVCSSKKR